MSTTPQKVCVIGAGASGITAAKALHERDIPFNCFEKGSAVGGLWRYENDNRLSAAYRSLHINTSRQRTQFSDFPMPADYPDFPHHSEMLRYLESYVDHFGFRPCIQFRTSVQQVRPLNDGTHAVTVLDPNGRKHTQQYRAVVIANGHHWHPRIPEFPGQFAGRVLHSHDYRTPDAMRGKRVLVVGIGNSGCDIACETSRVSEQTWLSTRRGAHVIPKYLFGKPLDRACPRWVWRYTPGWLFRRCFAAALWLARGRLGRFGLPEPRHDVLQEHPTISSDLLNLIGHGRIKVKPNISALAGSGVVFADGSQLPVDVLIYATGYDIRFPFLEESILRTDDNEVPLFKRVIHPEHPSLYFIGLVQPWGSILPLAELQSQWVAELLEETVSLPSREEMQKDIAKSRAKIRRQYTDSPRHTIQVDYYRYVEAIQALRRRRQAVAPPPVESRRREAA